MKAIFLLFLALLPSAVLADDMQAYLSETKQLVESGKFEEGLTRCIWFHEHALEHDKAMYGVRLSFALSTWKNLADRYPPAMTALNALRDSDEKKMIGEDGSSDLFADLTALNQCLDRENKTLEVFRTLDQQRPRLAKDCWHFAQDTVINAKEYELAGKYLGDPVRAFKRVKEMYDVNVKMYANPKLGGDHFKNFNEETFVKKTLQLINVALALKDTEGATEVQSLALEVFPDRMIRRAIPNETNSTLN